ncbi:MAG: cellobiose phosphorylase [Candidatus Omnitrophica bacterium]|nr:cellobiose phosphorylase [Candidatus Omnitrophota bacterium]
MDSKTKYKKPRYYLNAKNKEFVIENYNLAKPFADFFPGIAGKYGIPMWVFYVNRGQAIASFGTKDKDHAILEFLPANKSWQTVPLQGFRTFIKLSAGKDFRFYEPFHNGFTNLDYKLNNLMRITSPDLRLEECNLTLGLKVEVEYFTIPNDSYSALARIVTVRNLGSKIKRLQLMDGLPQVIPFGTSDLFLKQLSRTVEAWMNVENLEKNVPFFKLSVDPTDRPEVVHIKEGNFYLAYTFEKGKPRVIRPVLDPQAVFGPVTDFSCPREFLAWKKIPRKDFGPVSSKTPSSFVFLDFTLSGGEEKKLFSLIGYMRDKETLNSSLPRLLKPDYIPFKKEENKKIIGELEVNVETKSSSEAFNLYTRQTYLDNILRGGYPEVFQGKGRVSVFYLYGRKHGDLERDYNKFQIQPANFSQGNGNYRDMNQNRRLDIWFNPAIEEANLVTFFDLIQTDGFNPLVVKGVNFTLADKHGLSALMPGFADQKDSAKVMAFLEKPFTPGDLILFIKDKGIKLRIPFNGFLDALLSFSEAVQEAEHGEGFWTDHWAYNLDLLDAYLGVYPEKSKEIIFDKKIFSFFDNAATVKPRNEKYVLYHGKVRQLHSVAASEAKRKMFKLRSSSPNTVRTEYGKGEIYKATLINKFLCLVVNKMSSLDPFGCGIEMEADKPDWFDALNGLPGLFGSSVNETFELKRLCLVIRDSVRNSGLGKIPVTEEIYDFLCGLEELLKDCLSGLSPEKDLLYWDKSYALKEGYRKRTEMGLSGKEKDIDCARLIVFLENCLKKLDLAIDKAFDAKRNIYYAYFINEVTDYSVEGPSIKPKKFNQIKLPFFLEAQVHALRLSAGAKQAKALYEATRKSSLFDKDLKMYKCTAPLKDMPEEIGRCRVFPPGWLENESIWLHMEYKYLLELLRQGLFDKFYGEFNNLLIPFLAPEKYGRSILQNSSFLVSSAFSDKALHGNGFVARLSGSTAEFLHIWLVMNAGIKPFFLNAKGELNLRLSPVLKGWLFGKKDGSYSFNFLSKVSVTYHNPKKKDTFGANPAKIHKITFRDKDNNPVELASDVIPSPYAAQVRSRQVQSIDIFLK